MNTMNSLKVFIEAEKNNNTNMLLGITVISKPLNIHPPHMGKSRPCEVPGLKQRFVQRKQC